MDINKYKVFLQAVDAGSFSRVADALGYTPSGIVHMMNTLENEMGFPLLIRSRKGVRPTPDGERIVPVLRELVRWEEQLNQVTSDICGIATGTIHIGTYYSIAVNWLPEVIKAFERDFPNVHIMILEGVHQQLDEWLDEHRVDFCLFSHQPGSSNEWIPLRRDRMVAVLPKDHPRAGDGSFPIELCRSERFIMPAAGYDYDIMRVMDKYHITPNVRYSTGEDNAAISMVQQGLGVGVLNELTTVGRENDVVLLPLEPHEDIELGIALPSLKKAPPAVQRFIAYLRDYLAERGDK